MIAYVGSRGVHQPFRVDESQCGSPDKDLCRISVAASGPLTETLLTGPERKENPPQRINGKFRPKIRGDVLRRTRSLLQCPRIAGLPSA